ncbi:MATE family efflux transporter [Clostridium chromiireducens]|uniref:DNA-damage-inducible protein F n=1 Tax=Clostridium chromiireducens TaxID=225345 RepID=A0A1V4IF36_9CLOT|nr:MATE family efflux transporter [Clostridium chromiireducens]OPJ58601.1 DNA-damage-inducible protein F [Clostridium chromiireducens]RII35646.1 MATE family efflux transporter [Clostridium chromiireducens]
MSSKIKDMTVGKPLRLIFMFALPLIFGNIFQQLYTIVDTIVIGKFLGVEALAAVGAGAWLNWMVIDIIIGFTQGFSILISQYFGENNMEKLRKTVTMSTILVTILGVLMTIISLLAARPVLVLLNTPENIINDSLSFLWVAFCGIPAILAYNTCSAILRALGDSRTPLMAMITASIINVVLDMIFVLVFKLGIIGPAIATVIAQIFSFIYCINNVRKLSILKLTLEDFNIDMYMIRKLTFLGAPISFQNGIIGFGGLVVQYVVNGFGFMFVAGFTATNKLYGILELVAVALGYSMATFTGQNLGAKKYDRIRIGMNSALKMAVGTSVILSAILFLFGRYFALMFISGNPQEVKQVTDIAYKYLMVMSSMLFILYMLHIYRNALQGMGDTIIPMVSGIVELCMRISVALFLPLLIGETGIYFAEVAAWLGAEVILMITYYIRIRKLKDNDKNIVAEAQC